MALVATACEAFGEGIENLANTSTSFKNVIKKKDAGVQKILYINSYHDGYAWSDGVTQGLRDVLASSQSDVDISMEYLDSRRFPGERTFDLVADVIKAKYKDYKFDLVIVSDNAAFDFMTRFRDELFPGVPIVFCGYNYFRPEYIKGLSDVTGVNEEIDMVAAVDMALAVHPRTSTLVFLLSTGDVSSRHIEAVAEARVLPRFAQSHKVVVLKDASMREIRESLAALPEDSLLFLCGQTRDQGEGRSLTPEENGRLLAAACRFPVYTFWDMHLQTGVLGGRVIFGMDQGRAAGELALRVLSGEAAGSIPVLMTTPAKGVFDYERMGHFGIRESQLPPNSLVINKPTSLWALYRFYILGAAVLVFLEAVLITFLITAMRQRRHALIALRDERDQLDRNVAERTRELSEANSMLQRLSEQDGLTGVANRRKFETVWNVEWNRALRQGRPLAVALVDVDHFKAYNDHYGHLLGDECLKRVAGSLASSARRAGELTARYGGEEFVVVLPGLSQDEASRAVQLMRKAVEAQNISHATSDVAPVVTVSIGLAVRVPVDGETPDSLLRDADDCLYQAKHRGRNQVVAAGQAVSAIEP